MCSSERDGGGAGRRKAAIVAGNAEPSVSVSQGCAAAWVDAVAAFWMAADFQDRCRTGDVVCSGGGDGRVGASAGPKAARKPPRERLSSSKAASTELEINGCGARRALCQIETEILGRPVDVRRTDRQARWRLLVDAFEPCCALALARSAKRAGAPRRSATRCRARKGPTRFINDGRVEIDSNVIERPIRPIALTQERRCSRDPMVARSTGP